MTEYSTFRLNSRMLSLLFLFLLLGGASAANAQGYVEGISTITTATNSSDLYTLSQTYVSYDLQLYYSAEVLAQILDNGNVYATSQLYGEDAPGLAEVAGDVSPLKIGDTYEIDGYHYVLATYVVSDGSGGYYYDNPGGLGFAEGTDPSGYQYTEGTPGYVYQEQIYLGSTAFAISTAPPQLTGISPQGDVRGKSGTITLTGQNLLDVLDQSTTPAVRGSGVHISISGTPSATQVMLNYSIDQNATDGAHQITIATRFGESDAEIFTVGDPSPVVLGINPPIWPAGTTIPLTVTGTGFGTNPSVTIAGVGVLTPSPSVSGASDTTLNTSVPIAQNAPDGPATIQVQSHGISGSGFVQGTPGQSSSGSNGADISAAPAPVPQIMFMGNNVSGTTQTVYAGQQIALTVNAPTGYSINTQQWSFGNQQDITGGFIATSRSGQEAADPQLNTGSVTFYWVVPGVDNETVSYTYQLSNGRSASASVTFNVDGPTGNVLPNVFVNTTDAATSIQPSNDPSLPDTTLIGMKGSPINPFYGVFFNVANATPPKTTAGVYVFAQILDTVMLQRITSSGYQAPTLANEQLDGGYPYPTADGMTVHDAPATYVSNTYGESGEKFGATMYVMWDPALPSGCIPAHVDSTTTPYTYVPSMCTSMPIPLSSAHWGWSNCAVNQGVDGAPNWTLKCGPGSKQTPQASGYPIWSSCSASKFGSCK
jgi:hypothetical protein